MSEAKAIPFSALPALGAEFEGGTFRGVTTLKDGTHVAVILLPNRTKVRMGFKNAITWAEEVGGQLITRSVAALLFATVKDEFDSDAAHWTADEAGTPFAWYFYFLDGRQYHLHQSTELYARAVRLIPLAA